MTCDISLTENLRQWVHRTVRRSRRKPNDQDRNREADTKGPADHE